MARSKRRTRSDRDREVAYVRRSADTLYPYYYKDTDSGRMKIETVTVTTKAGTKYEIPVGKDGKIPEQFVVARFLDESVGVSSGAKRRNVPIDTSQDALIMHEYPKGGFTPREMIMTGWWQHPAEPDIKGIDDSSVADLRSRLTGLSAAQKQRFAKITMIMPPESYAKAVKTIQDDFTAAEIRKMGRYGLVIAEGNPGPGASGFYAGRVEGRSIQTPLIMLETKWDEDTLVHELTHHLRQVDDTRGGLMRTPFPLNSEGQRLPSGRSTGHAFFSARNLEEAATVAEATVRTRQATDQPTGYYTYTNLHGSTYKERYRHDRGLLTKAGAKKGRAAERAVSSQFADTSISGLRYKAGDRAIDYYRAREKAGTLPVAVRPRKAAKGLLPGAAGGTAVPVTANIRLRRRR